MSRGGCSVLDANTNSRLRRRRLRLRAARLNAGGLMLTFLLLACAPEQDAPKPGDTTPSVDTEPAPEPDPKPHTEDPGETVLDTGEAPCEFAPGVPGEDTSPGRRSMPWRSRTPTYFVRWKRTWASE